MSLPSFISFYLLSQVPWALRPTTWGGINVPQYYQKVVVFSVWKTPAVQRGKSSTASSLQLKKTQGTWNQVVICNVSTDEHNCIHRADWEMWNEAIEQVIIGLSKARLSRKWSPGLSEQSTSFWSCSRPSTTRIPIRRSKYSAILNPSHESWAWPNYPRRDPFEDQRFFIDDRIVERPP